MPLPDPHRLVPKAASTAAAENGLCTAEPLPAGSCRASVLFMLTVHMPPASRTGCDPVAGLFEPKVEPYREPMARLLAAAGERGL
jgi:hypothetical protein